MERTRHRQDCEAWTLRSMRASKVGGAIHRKSRLSPADSLVCPVLVLVLVEHVVWRVLEVPVVSFSYCALISGAHPVNCWELSKSHA